jgi:predicted AAA+ superfamily ATPase
VSLSGLLSAGDASLEGATGLGLGDYTDEIVRSGFPGMRHLTGRARRAQLDGNIARIVDKDMPEAGFRARRPATVLAWLRAYAAATATSASYESIRDAATSGVSNKPTKTTTSPYIDTLTDMRILDPLPAWTPSLNQLRRLTQAPKHHLADPALAARLLHQTRASLLDGDSGPVDLLRDGTLLGALFESLVVLSARVYAQAGEAAVHHLRTYGGEHEVDLIVERGDGRVLAIEVKLSAAVRDRDVRHLAWLRDKVGDRLIDAVVVCTGPQAYRRPDGIGVVPLALLGP